MKALARQGVLESHIKYGLVMNTYRRASAYFGRTASAWRKPDRRMTYINKDKPSVTVELIVENAEFRLGEIRKRIVIYKRNEKHYARTAEEFSAKFRRAGY